MPVAGSCCWHFCGVTWRYFILEGMMSEYNPENYTVQGGITVDGNDEVSAEGDC